MIKSFSQDAAMTSAAVNVDQQPPSLPNHQAASAGASMTSSVSENIIYATAADPDPKSVLAAKPPLAPKSGSSSVSSVVTDQAAAAASSSSSSVTTTTSSSSQHSLRPPTV